MKCEQVCNLPFWRLQYLLFWQHPQKICRKDDNNSNDEIDYHIPLFIIHVLIWTKKHDAGSLLRKVDSLALPFTFHFIFHWNLNLNLFTFLIWAFIWLCFKKPHLVFYLYLHFPLIQSIWIFAYVLFWLTSLITRAIFTCYQVHKAF